MSAIRLMFVRRGGCFQVTTCAVAAWLPEPGQIALDPILWRDNGPIIGKAIAALAWSPLTHSAEVSEGNAVSRRRNNTFTEFHLFLGTSKCQAEHIYQLA